MIHQNKQQLSEIDFGFMSMNITSAGRNSNLKRKVLFTILNVFGNNVISGHGEESNGATHHPKISSISSLYRGC